MGKPSDLVQGTLDLLILKTVSLEAKHGWAIAKRIQQVSGEVLQVQQGSLYPALHRLEQQGWIRGKWEESDTGRQAKFYWLTAAASYHAAGVFDKSLPLFERLAASAPEMASLSARVYLFAMSHSAAAMKSSNTFCLFSFIPALCHSSPYSPPPRKFGMA